MTPVPAVEEPPLTPAQLPTSIPVPPTRRRLRVRRTVSAAAAAVLAMIVATVASAPMLPLPDPNAQTLADRVVPPLSRGADGTRYPAGTDQLGRDVLSRTVYGGRLSVAVAVAVVLLSSVTGSVVGLVAGYQLGWFDVAAMRLADFQMAFPPLLLAVFLLYELGPNIGNLVALLAAFGWVRYARVARAQTLALRALPFVEGAVGVGCSDRRILLRHLLPHLLPTLSVVAVFEFAGVMLAEAGLSFLGLGVQPPAASWGLMLSQGQQFVTTGGWWLIVAPGGAIFLTTLCANLSARWAQTLLQRGKVV